MTKLATLALALSACVTTSDDAGLTLEHDAADRVAGTFERDGITVAFDLSLENGRHTAALRDANGAGLMTTTLDGAVQTSDVLDGRLIVSGIQNAPNPTIEGDRAASDELAARPEAAVMPDLFDALAAHGVASDLLDPQPEETQSIWDNGDGYFGFGRGEWKSFWSAGWGNGTTIYVRNPWPNAGRCAQIKLIPHSAAAMQYIFAYPSSQVATSSNPYGWTRKTVYWWGALFTVENAAQDTYVAGNNCGATDVLIAVR